MAYDRRLPSWLFFVVWRFRCALVQFFSTVSPCAGCLFKLHVSRVRQGHHFPAPGGGMSRPLTGHTAACSNPRTGRPLGQTQRDTDPRSGGAPTLLHVGLSAPHSHSGDTSKPQLRPPTATSIALTVVRGLLISSWMRVNTS